MSKALIDAINARDLDGLARLLAAGEDPKQPLTSTHTSPTLHHAVSSLGVFHSGRPSGSINAVVLLLRYGADVNAWDAQHWDTPLLCAFEVNHEEAIRLLLAAGADPNVRNAEDESPLYQCVKSKRYEMARLLLHCGATKTIDKGGGPAGMHALGLATSRLDVEMVKLLLEFGADPHAEDVDHMTAFRQLEFLAVPEDPGEQERFHEICRLFDAELVPDEP